MAIFRSLYALDTFPMPSPNDASVKSIRMRYSLLAALALNDVIYMGDLPANCIPVDFLLDSDDVDTNVTPLITLGVGILNGTDNGLSSAAADGGAGWLLASTIGQAGGMARPTTNVISRVLNSDTDRRVGVHVSAAPATGTTTGDIGLTLLYRAANYGR